MEFYIANIPYKANDCDVISAIASQVLHNPSKCFVAEVDVRLPNFKVELDMSTVGVRNIGTGKLTLAQPLGRIFQRINSKDPIRVSLMGRKLTFSPRKEARVDGSLALELNNGPFVDPKIKGDHAWRMNVLCDPFFLTRVQFGTFYKTDGASQTPRTFSVEWDGDFGKKSMALLLFNYQNKSLRIQMGHSINEQTFKNLVIRFSNISNSIMGRSTADANPYVCFELLTPPVIQEEDIHRPPQEAYYKGKYLRRLESLNERHKAVAPYAHQLRIELYNNFDDCYSDILEKFVYYCQISTLRPPQQGETIKATVRHKLFCDKKLDEIDKWLCTLDNDSKWSVGFQVRALLSNGIASTAELKELRPFIEELVHTLGDAAGDVMRRFVEGAAHRPSGQQILESFDSVRKSGALPRTPPRRGRFFSYHVTVTPTRMLLEGPTVIQSNRVIREYEGYEDHFLRVDFRDEDCLQYRWERDVDGESFLQKRIGGLLKRGFDLAGRRFEFLGYSSSALKEHAVWYVNPFKHPQKGQVTAESIRSSLGDFSGVIRSPSKYGARMAQAFSGTDPSVRIKRDQWKIIPDIKENGINFTDGVGRISPELSDRIWSALCDDDPSLLAFSIKPSIYQIRFLGCKGVVSVDQRLTGICMCVRPSMNKFTVHGQDDAAIEIAQAFTRPNVAYLNRPLVKVLEDRGVPIEAFLRLQRDVVASVRTAHDSAARYAALLESNQLCNPYRVATILKKLNALGLELKPQGGALQKSLDTPFLARLRACAIEHVLRAVKHQARLPIPNSHMLVGVADEGPAYVKQGMKGAYCLPQGNIFACVQNRGDEQPRYIQGPCLVFRNPVIHPGDVQRVYAIGQPPKDRTCLFSHLKNTVVFPATGTSSLPNALAGGDLDGDMYIVAQYGDFLVPEHYDPASYPPAEPLKLDRDCTIDDLCNFVVEFIHSDVVGIVSSKHITIADQTDLGTLHPDCIKLASMHPQAVDYPKNGNRVDIDDMPRSRLRLKPDWDAVVGHDDPSDYYLSDRALGYLYRNIDMKDTTANELPMSTQHYRLHPISATLRPLVRRHLPRSEGGGPPQAGQTQSQETTDTIDAVYTMYREELTFMSGTYALSERAGSRLLEEELVVGTILARSTQRQYRSNRVHAMRDDVGCLVQDVRAQLVGKLEGVLECVVQEKLAVAWAAWTWSVQRATSSATGVDTFGAESFGLIALGLVLECLERLDAMKVETRVAGVGRASDGQTSKDQKSKGQAIGRKSKGQTRSWREKGHCMTGSNADSSRKRPRAADNASLRGKELKVQTV